MSLNYTPSDDLLVVKINQFNERPLARVQDLKRNETWKDQMQDWTYAMLEDGVCAGAGRDFKIKESVVNSAMYDWKVIK